MGGEQTYCVPFSAWLRMQSRASRVVSQAVQSKRHDRVDHPQRSGRVSRSTLLITTINPTTVLSTQSLSTKSRPQVPTQANHTHVLCLL